MRRDPKFETLEFRPARRLDVIDVRRILAANGREPVTRYPRGLYVSYHTTAGYVDPRLSARLDHDPEALRDFFQAFRTLFPPDAGYHHDQMERREELSEEQKSTEPRNADSHLTFIGAGMVSCVSYEQDDPQRPVWFVDLDGTNGPDRRRRRTSVIGYNEEELVARESLEVPVSAHPVDSVNLRDDRVGFLEQLQERIRDYGITKGRLDVRLAPDERHAGLTVNEYETLLMKHDLGEVLRNPFHYMAEKGKHVLQDPRSVPGKTLSYAQYDGVQVLNKLMDLFGVSESVVERLLNRMLAFPASRFLRMKRGISLPVMDEGEPGTGRIVEGTYQSPILVQWKKSHEGSRRMEVSFVRFR
ncbi:MAG: hypothetical protein GWM92_00965 [Gemmatimonadetes bacterium]|nr:hypothetical protein [Gemmatimonadota bacterium]NIR77024.1 hypothetical protein [Gemmatimonadota bacterium]NIT85553.1 hypothetical protein [Gemmatimonadota bacterium]NIU29383.1 hypothetical protein [Gemmatimonadota bacterium]NIU34439.1 hypothetical protein [Gemmatimonadota bacterium]